MVRLREEVPANVAGTLIACEPTTGVCYLGFGTGEDTKKKKTNAPSPNLLRRATGALRRCQIQGPTGDTADIWDVPLWLRRDQRIHMPAVSERMTSAKRVAGFILASMRAAERVCGAKVVVHPPVLLLMLSGRYSTSRR
jgi:hypothetical protein